MTEIGERLSEDLEALKTLRDEIRVRIHLGKREALDRWEEAEKRWEQIEGKLEVIRRESKESLQEIGRQVGILMHEVGQAYREIKKGL
jgi:hypothetical protein